MALSRRGLLAAGLLGVGGLGAMSLLKDSVPSYAGPTPEAGGVDGLPDFGPVDASALSAELAQGAKATEDNILGPYHRQGAPFRGKVTPMLAEGEPLLVVGRVWGLDTRKPISFAIVDVWQADSAGRYDNDDPRRPVKPGVFLNRARMVSDEQGRYEYETVRPGRYQLGPSSWRTSHIHYRVSARGYRTLVTQMFFPDDKLNAQDDFIKPTLIAQTRKMKVGRKPVWFSVFDVVLDKV
jgi:catechol 1,2-dioxygenase